jgi:glycine/D-amino acid oxidase-like deaminating enzyme
VPTRFDVAVVGAGVFGAWIAYTLQRSGRSVVVADGYGPGNSRASSGGESRIIRAGYGLDVVYSRWARLSRDRWKEILGPSLFLETGVLWLARPGHPYVAETERTLRALEVPVERLGSADLAGRYPQLGLDGVDWALFEPDAGVIMARRAVQAILHEAVRLGATFVPAPVQPPEGDGRLERVLTTTGDSLHADTTVFAAGPWLPRLFPAVVGDRVQPTRQEVFFFGVPGADRRYAPPAMPAWIDFGLEAYGVPDLDGRGLKIGLDRHGPPFDPDTGNRLASDETARVARGILATRFPALVDAPVLEARVCQYENTSTGDFLIDRHPDYSNVWIVGGGSGHGFKHGPAVAEYVVERLAGQVPVEPRFSLATKQRLRKRQVY